MHQLLIIFSIGRVAHAEQLRLSPAEGTMNTNESAPYTRTTNSRTFSVTDDIIAHYQLITRQPRVLSRPQETHRTPGAPTHPPQIPSPRGRFVLPRVLLVPESGVPLPWPLSSPADLRGRPSM
ncbi:hypothetical protein C8Q80DRAFT_1184433, partial [Daedaleopsis nitida]